MEGRCDGHTISGIAYLMYRALDMDVVELADQGKAGAVDKKGRQAYDNYSQGCREMKPTDVPSVPFDVVFDGKGCGLKVLWSALAKALASCLTLLVARPDLQTGRLQPSWA